MAAPLVGLLRRGSSLEPERWTVLAWSLGLLAVLASIAIGRAGLDPEVRLAKSSRYAAFAQPLVPITLVAWTAWLRDGLPQPLAWLSRRATLGPLRPLTDPARGRVLVLALVWSLACCGHADDWRLTLYPHEPHWGELFDHRNDPGEHRNLFNEPEHGGTRVQLTELLQSEFPAVLEEKAEILGTW